MAKFQFRLATLLKLRESARDQRRAHLAEAYRVEQVLRARLDNVDQQLAWLRDTRRAAAGPGNIDVDALVESQRWELTLTMRRQDVLGQCQSVEEEIERRRAALVEADREVRVLEKLREKQLARHRHEEQRLEIKELDEVAVRRAAEEVAR